MKKDKEWLKFLINEEGIIMDMHLLGRLDEQYWKNENIKINKGRLFYLIDQLDEPEKPVIPKFVAVWIEETKKQGKSLVFAITHIYYKNEIGKSPNKEEKKIFQWMELAYNEEVFARAWIDGYEVEKEKLYRIKFSDNQYATRLNNRKINSILTDEEFATQYTESEIKAIDKRYWAFAEEVTE